MRGASTTATQHPHSGGYAMNETDTTTDTTKTGTTTEGGGGTTPNGQDPEFPVTPDEN